MQKFRITSEIEQRVKDFYSTLFNIRDFKHPKDALNDLLKTRGYKTGWKHRYVKTLVSEFDKIMLIEHKDFDKWKKIFDDIKVLTPKKDTKFWKKIVEVLRYKDLREKEYMELYQEMGIKTCMYCNASLSVSADIEFYKRPKKKKGTVKERKATFELDHYIAKSEYPFLAISFFNLIPSCSVCNKAKSFNGIDYYPYEKNNNNLEAFKFELDKKSIIKYWKSREYNDLSFQFVGVGGSNIKDYEKTFHIQGIYETQKDIIEELVHKKEAYTNSYKEGLVNIFNKKIFQDTSMVNRLLIGNYDKVEEIHKRPLAKFTQDIAKDLKLIK